MELEELCDNLFDTFHNSLYYGEGGFYARVFYFVALYGSLCVWIVGIVGNLVNMVVFSHKNMVHPINSIFWWLSISDLFELAVFALHQWCCGWTGNLKLNPVTESQPSYVTFLLLLWSIYLLQVFHTITVGLNIVLAFWRYLAVAHPLIINKIPCNHHSVKLAVICLYVLGFVLYLPVWYIYQIQTVKSMGPGYYGISVRYPYDGFDPSAYTSESTLVNASIIFCGVVLRIGPFVVLIILSALLIYGVIKAGRDRRQLGGRDSHISEEDKRMNQINITIIVIVFMFLITEIPFGISGFFVLLNTFFCIEVLSYILHVTILLNSSYSIFCYLITSRNYRKTLWKLLPKKWDCIRFPVVSVPTIEVSL